MKLLYTLRALIICLLIFSSGCTVILGNDAAVVAHFLIEPSPEVEVGEEVLFDATNGMYYPYSSSQRFEWDFGDGYGMKWGFPNSTRRDSGISCTHFYTAPGEYTVTLTATSNSENADRKNEQVRATKKIKVTGFPRTFKFDLLHANFHARIAQYVYVRVADTATDATRATVILQGDNGYNKDFGSFALRPGQEASFLLRNADLPQGNYTMLARLYGTGNTVIDEIKDKFSKPYSGIPKVGINENNAICRDGIPFFPVTPWLLNYIDMENWKQQYVNSCNGEGWYQTHTVTTWMNYLTHAALNNLPVTGPERWQGKGALIGAVNYYRNSDITRLREYVQASKDKPGLLMYSWLDEPNMGGADLYTPAQVYRSWTYLSHKIDPQHPVYVNLYGFDYLPYYDNAGHTADRYYNIMTNQIIFGRSVCVTDVASFDCYPLEFKNHASYEGTTDGAELELHIGAIQRFYERTHNLIPFMNFIETCNIDAQGTNGIMPEQLEMLIWLSVVHGAKGICWFHYFNPTPPDNYAKMQKFTRQITALQGIVLGPEPVRTVSDNQNTRNHRVDTMIRETPTDIWIFAVRITELTNEASSITATFNVGGSPSGTVQVYDESRSIPISGGAFTDTFTFGAAHIYKIPK